jgi:hypothetical protein
MHSEVSEVRVLLSALTAKVKESVRELKAQEISNALYGLQGMNSDVPEVRSWVRVLVGAFGVLNVLCSCFESFWIRWLRSRFVAVAAL